MNNILTHCVFHFFLLAMAMASHLPCSAYHPRAARRAIVVTRGSFIGYQTEDSIKGINRCALVGKSRTSNSRSRINCQKITANVDVEQWVKKSREDRIRHLEDQALWILKSTIDSSQNPAFPCALIAGDVVILDLLSKLGVLSDGRVKIIFIDTFHLFPETYSFLEALEKRYGFKAHVFHVAGVENKEEYSKQYGTDLFLRDIDEYDKICKVEPFNRSLISLEVDAMINGRRRDHGAERAHLEVAEAGAILKVQPLAYWEFRDVWEYLEKYGIPYHPLHDQGYPSVGDIQSTLPVPREKWFEYGGERSGRFQGLKNKDGTTKTECGIHVGGSPQ